MIDYEKRTLLERQEIPVDFVLMGRAHAMVKARINFQRRLLDDLGREHRRGADRTI
jgi:hypothetical protein